MQNFLVLGLIPGTNTQITFTSWLIMSGTLLAIVGTRYVLHSRAIRFSLIGMRILADIRSSFLYY